MERLRVAYVRRNETDYILRFWSALGWTLLTCGIFGFFVFSQLFRRMRDHNQRRLELLEAARELAWSRAVADGVSEELRGEFERVGMHLGVLRALTTEFRDPNAWLAIYVTAVAIGVFARFLPHGIGGVFSFGSAVVQVTGYWLLDGDLVKHDYHEGAAESDLATIFDRLGHPIERPDPARLHGRHNNVGRVVATVFTCGIYALWWLHDQMVEPNRHFEENWRWEESLAQAAQAMDLR